MTRPDRPSPVHLCRDRRGLAAMEFALIAPLLVLVFIGLIEASNFVYSHQKVESAAANVLSIASRQPQLSVEDLRQIAQIVPEVARPIAVNDAGYRVVYTAVQRDRPAPNSTSFTPPYVLWQESFGNRTLGEPTLRYHAGGGSAHNALRPGDLNDLPFSPGEQVIVVEVFLRNAPTLATGFTPASDRVMHARAFTRARRGAISALPRARQEGRD